MFNLGITSLKICPIKTYQKFCSPNMHSHWESFLYELRPSKGVICERRSSLQNPWVIRYNLALLTRKLKACGIIDYLYMDCYDLIKTQTVLKWRPHNQHMWYSVIQIVWPVSKTYIAWIWQFVKTGLSEIGMYICSWLKCTQRMYFTCTATVLHGLQ